MNRIREFCKKWHLNLSTVFGTGATVWAAAFLPWWAASLISNAAIIATEYTNRYATGGWGSVLPRTLPLIIVAQFCLFRTFNGASHWMWAWAVFTVGNSFMRVGSLAAFGDEAVGSWPKVITGVCIMVSGALFMKMGLRAS
jgi:hypothetical protein